MLGFNNTSTLVGHFVSSPREREKRHRRGSRGDEREGHGRKIEENEFCVGVKRHVNLWGSFCVISQRKGEKR